MNTIYFTLISIIVLRLWLTIFSKKIEDIKKKKVILESFLCSLFVIAIRVATDGSSFIMKDLLPFSLTTVSVVAFYYYLEYLEKKTLKKEKKESLNS